LTGGNDGGGGILNFNESIKVDNVIKKPEAQDALRNIFPALRLTL
jgi:hypothetical protein